MSEASVEQAIVAAVNPLVPCYPLAAADGQAMPYVAYSLIYGMIENTMCGRSNLSNYRIRLDLYAQTRAQLLTLRELVIDAVCALPGTPIPVSDMDAFEPEIVGMRRTIDFSIWNAVTA
jgi:hypothetical protein